MTVRRLICAFALPVALAAVCAFAFFHRSVDLRTSLYDLVGSAADVVPEAVREHSSRLVPVLVSSTNAAAARAAADRLVAFLPTNSCSSVRYRVDAEAFSEFLEICRRNRAGLVSDSDARLLETPEGRARIARAAARRYYSSPVQPLFPPAEDPFCLTDSFVTSLPLSFSLWMPQDGVLTARLGERIYVLIVLELKTCIAGDTDALISFKSALDDAFRKASSTDASFAACGVPLHTAVTAARCKTEIGWLTWFSLAFIALLSVCVFRSLRWIPLLSASLVVSALAGAAALLTFFSSVHVMTLVFGTTVLGLVIDYSFHWLLQAAESRAETLRNLLVSFFTTQVSLLPLALSTLPVLRQTAVFLGTALAAALAYVIVCYPSPGATTVRKKGGVRVPFAFALAALLLATGAAGFFNIVFATDPAAVYRPDASLAETERVFAELSGTADGKRGFLVTDGSDDLEELLSLEETAAAGKIACLSRFMPSLSRRGRIAGNVAKLYEEHAARQKELLALTAIEPPPAPRAWRWSDIPKSAAAFVHGHSLVVPSSPPPASALRRGVRFCRPKSILANILDDWSNETRSRLLVSLALMFAVLVVFCRARAFLVMLPSLSALFCVAGWLSLAGSGINLFHLLASFLLAGMGVDYTVFLHSGGRAAFKPAFCSLLTSVAGFGALSFVSFPVVNAFGVVLGLGLPMTFLVACATAPKERSATEHGASPLGMEVLYAVYRVFGLRALHASASCVGLVLWTFSRAVRRASPSPRKIIAFTHSLADKLVVMAGARGLPKVEVDDSADAQAFLKDVASRRGVFVLSSHCGTIEVLAALGECDVTFHAWMEFTRTSVFNAFYMRHAKRTKVVIHPISSFGPETVFEAGDALDGGECLVMAGDRGFGRMRDVAFGDGEIRLPEGAFRFARALAHPVYFVACVAVASCRYRAIVRRLPAGSADEMALAYAAALYETTQAYEHQWFKWEGKSE